ncbi:MAG: desulfoferrodoxin family protein [Phycisphaerae bacterium]
MLSIQRKNLLVGVNRARDQGNLSVLEQMHLPRIECPDRVGADEAFTITVTVGSPQSHPCSDRHFIERVNIYADETLLASVLPRAKSSPPRARVRVSLRRDVEEIRVQATCNLHGTWETSREISVDTGEE